MNFKNIFIILFSVFIIFSCGKNYTPEEKDYISKIEQQRIKDNEWYKNDPNSPFNKKGKVEFHDLKYYDVDPSFVFKSKLYEYGQKDTVTIYGTKGEPRETVRFGYVQINKDGKNYKIHVYESGEEQKYYSIWFTDKTTNETTYGVGRYLNFERASDPENIYTIDFNLAYNPYCAYTSNYSCAIPTKEDYIDLAIEAGEKKFHD
ncbi:MAG: hypothetical protein A2068_00700 [Ignavibacteria bacterium GWB2_35_6b]|nr:MAG: hypothetical protein A2068_00700 [Ignavibacteria bacterium GWB2_35_6b]